MSSPESEPSAPPRGRPELAWLVILAVVGFIVYRATSEGAELRQRGDAVSLHFQVRYLVGIADWLDQRKEAYQQARALQRGNVAKRLVSAIVAGELAGPGEALRQLDDLRQQIEQHPERLAPTAEQQELLRLLERLYQTEKTHPPGAAALTREEQEQLPQHLGWSGRLALVSSPQADPAAREEVLAPARRLAQTLVAVTVAALLLAVVGFCVLVVFVVLWLTGRLRFRLEHQGPGGLYAEAFALWMVLYLALGVLQRYVFPRTSFDLLLHGIVMLLSLIPVLLWPVWRGLPWQQVRRDLGLWLGPTPGREVLFGVAAYLAALPLLILGLLFVVVLMGLQQKFFGPVDPFGPTNQPSHPVAEEILGAPAWMFVQVLFAAALVAPVVEEVLFRGLLYRHLRGRCSVLVSALVVSFVFAVIHPQGWLGLPVLMILAVCFALVREWRGTLLPSMIAHGLNNGFVTGLLWSMSR